LKHPVSCLQAAIVAALLESYKTGTMGLASSSSCGRPQPSRE